MGAFIVDDEGLVLRSSRLYPAAHDCRFRPNGLHVFRRGDLRGVLPWDDGRGADSTPVRLGIDPQSGRWSIQPRLDSAAAAVGTHRRQYALRRFRPRGRRAARWRADTECAAALSGYLSATPDARAALDDHDRLRALLDEVLPMRGGVDVTPPTDTARAEVHARVQRRLDTEYRRFQGRPVAGEPWPSIDEVVGWLEANPPPGIDPQRVPDAEVRAVVVALVAVEAWPFSMLLPEPDGT